MICSIDNCKKRAWYNFSGLEPVVCCTHKSEDMINVVQKLCIQPGCVSRAIFGKDKIKTHCSKHKEEESVNVNQRLCECGGQATYGFAGCKPISCVIHAGFMHVNLITPTCSEKGCYLKACYRVAGQSKDYYCKKHKTQDMTDFKARCECGKQASFGYPGGAKQCCKSHALEGMINIKLYTAKAKKFSSA